MKKLCSLILAVLLVGTISLTAFAQADVSPNLAGSSGGNSKYSSRWQDNHRGRNFSTD